MSSLIVEISNVEKVLPHNNADTLEIVVVKGWQCVVPKGHYHTNDNVVYIPADAVLPISLSDRLGVTKHLSKGKVRRIKLRGEYSFGLIIDKENPEWMLGEDVADYYNITKFEPPSLQNQISDAIREHPLFFKYTTIENFRDFPNILNEGEEVVITEKVHGVNSRIAIINGEKMAGSHRVQRKVPEMDEDNSLYWGPWKNKDIVRLMVGLALDHKQVVLYGEIFGPKIQSLSYGRTMIDYAAFDLLLDGQYIEYQKFLHLCIAYDIPHVPQLYQGKFSLEQTQILSKGQSLLGGDHYKEGIVIKPLKERTDPKIGRVILKYINDDYMFSKYKEEEKRDD